MQQAFAFDLDGTLLDTETLWVGAATAYLQEHGESLSAVQAVALVYGRSWSDIHADICRRYPRAALPRDAAAQAMRRHMLRLREGTDCVIHGSVSLLKRLASEAPVCVVSGSPRDDVEEGVRLAGIDCAVCFVLGAEDYAPGKPDPACYLLAAERLGIPAGCCTVFEDSTAGVLAARAAGMYTVALSRPGLPPQDVSAAHQVVTDLAAYQPPA